MKLNAAKTRYSLLDKFFSFLEKLSLGDRALFMVGMIIFLTSAATALITLNNQYLHSTPVQGGTHVEGIIGTPRFINPVLAITRADHDVVALVYSGLLRLDNTGQLVPDVATDIERSEDGTEYTVHLRDDVYFHNGQKLTSADVAYTIELIQNPDLKSPLRSNWEGVAVTVIDDTTLTLTLRDSYYPFIENLTVGILPKSVWSTLPIEQLPFSQHNTEPIGTGPYQVETVSRNDSGLIESYTLTASPYTTDIPNINTIEMRFFSNTETLRAQLQDGTVTATQSLEPADLTNTPSSHLTIVEDAMSRTFGAFYNQNRSTVLRDSTVREALALVTDKERLVEEVLNGHGSSVNTPIPMSFLATTTTFTVQSSSSLNRVQQAERVLLAGDWQQKEDGTWFKTVDDSEVKLALTISTANSPVFEQTAQSLKNMWSELGIDVQIEQFTQSDLIQSIVRPRNFEILLYGIDAGRTLDMYPFWHSSQKDDPGLNITRYTNIDADYWLEIIRESDDTEKRTEASLELFELLESEKPVLFLFSPTLTYIHTEALTIPETDLLITAPHERFANVRNWHIASEDLWPWFTPASTD